MSAAVADPWSAQRKRHRREQEAKRRYREERRQRERAAFCRTGCALCGWSFEGSAEAGQKAARDHRSAEHPDRPVHSRKRRNRDTRPAKPAIARRAANREAVLKTIKQLGAVWASLREISERAGLTPHETGRLLRAEGYEHTKWRGGTRLYWLGRSNPPERRLICALDGCDVEFVPNSGSQKFCCTSHRDRTYGRAR